MVFALNDKTLLKLIENCRTFLGSTKNSNYFFSNLKKETNFIEICICCLYKSILFIIKFAKEATLCLHHTNVFIHCISFSIVR